MCFGGEKNSSSKPVQLLSERGFSLVELMVVVAIIGVMSTVAIPSYKKFQERTRDSARKYHLAMYMRMLRAEYEESGRLRTVAAYGESSYGGWDSSGTDINGNGSRFLDFLGAQQPLDPLNNTTGDLWQGGASVSLTNGFAYQYYCYPVHPLGHWGSTNLNPIAVIITRLEEIDMFYFIRVDNVACN